MAHDYVQLKEFVSFLMTRNLLPEKKISYYQSCIAKYSAFHGVDLNTSVQISDDLINDFVTHLARKYEDWQVDQAGDALRLLLFFQAGKKRGHVRFWLLACSSLPFTPIYSSPAWLKGVRPS